MISWDLIWYSYCIVLNKISIEKKSHNDKIIVPRRLCFADVGSAIVPRRAHNTFALCSLIVQRRRFSIVHNRCAQWLRTMSAQWFHAGRTIQQRWERTMKRTMQAHNESAQWVHNGSARIFFKYNTVACINANQQPWALTRHQMNAIFKFYLVARRTIVGSHYEARYV